MCAGNGTFGNDLSTRPPYFAFQKFPTSADLSCSWSLSAIRAMNSELVGFSFGMQAKPSIDRRGRLCYTNNESRARGIRTVIKLYRCCL